MRRFTRDNLGVWTQQGGLLQGKDGGSVPASGVQGRSISLAADGNTLAIGSSGIDTSDGGTFIFTQDKNGQWKQQENLLQGEIGGMVPMDGRQGFAVSFSADGNTLAVGGISINGDGGAFIFV